MQWLIFEKSSLGHRGEYSNIFSIILEGKQITGFSQINLLKLLKSPAVLFSSCDDYIVCFFVISLLRAWFGRPSVAIATRAEAIYKPLTLKIKIKKLIYKLIRKNNRIKVLSTLPFYVEPRLREVVDDWIYDPQFWDLYYLKNKFKREITVLRVKCLKFGGVHENKLKLVLPGKISIRKGAKFMMDIFLSSQQIRKRFLFILGGEILDLNNDEISNFKKAGGYVIGRSPSFEELLDLYRLSDIIWCCYPRTFNHSSGIFGRALQLGVPVVVRKKSYLSYFNMPNSMRCTLEYGDTQGAVDALNKFAGQMIGVPLNFYSADKIANICRDSICKE